MVKISEAYRKDNIKWVRLYSIEDGRYVHFIVEYKHDEVEVLVAIDDGPAIRFSLQYDDLKELEEVLKELIEIEEVEGQKS